MSQRRPVLRAAAAAALIAALSTACTSAPAQQPTARPTPTTPRPSPTTPSSAPTTPEPAPTSAATSRAHRRGGARLPLSLPTGDARQAITVTASSATSTTGTLQAWRRVAGGWRRVGSPTRAWLGSDGLTRHASESRSATPIGSFTLTRAFGHDPDPGTRLPYTRTTPADWWISQPGPLYNTRQRCTSRCSFTQGAPNEHLYYETPYYDYAVVIDYNTRNAPGGVRQGAGSAFFLHVTVHAPTAGCISIDPGRLLRLLHWLAPADHPRILIGV